MNLAHFIARISRRKTARELLVEQGANAALERAHHAELREYHAAMEQMLMQRIGRIDRDLRRSEGATEVVCDE